MNKDVAYIQSFLNEHAGASLVVDGVGGSLTRAAFISAFVNKQAAAITDEEVLEIAKALGDSDTRRIKAVAQVESNGGGWFASGLPTILYERHYFWRLTSAANRVLSWFANPEYGGYTLDSNKNGLNDSWEKLSFAVCKDPIAALQSVSIGKFQIMGRWYRECGYQHPIEMLWAARNGEYAHYAMLRDYILNVAQLKRAFLAINGNADNCIPFAIGYNGSGYYKHGYHIRIARAYREVLI